MLDFDQLIRSIGPKAYASQLHDHESDQEAVKAIAAADGASRHQSLLRWLRDYAVWRRMKAAQLERVAAAALKWCDYRAARNSSPSIDYLVHAHAELATACRAAVNVTWRFDSLASKVLWLRYPYDTPMFDGNAQRALWVLSKCPSRVTLAPPNASTYGQFTAVWSQFYSRHREAIDSIDIGDYPYRVRIFDRILWMLGAPRYTLPI